MQGGYIHDLREIKRAVREGPLRGPMTTRAVVLAGGRGSRMRAADPGAELSAEQRRIADAGLKAMLPVAGRPFLDYLLSALADAGIVTVAIVCAPDHDLLTEYYEHLSRPERVRLSFAVQPEPRGTADALLAAEAWAGRDPFLAMNADNLYPVEGLRALAAEETPAFLAFRRGDLVRNGNIRDEQMHAYAIVEVDGGGWMSRIVEKPSPDLLAQAGETAIVSMNCWRFDRRIFQSCRDVPQSARGEFELPQAVMLAVERGVKFRAVPADGAVLDLSRRGDATIIARRLAGVPPRP